MWLSEPHNVPDLLHFSKKIHEAVFLGNATEAAYAIDIVYTHSQIGSITKNLLRKCIEMIAIEYTQVSLERTLFFLSAIVSNPNSRDVNINQEMYLIAELLICMLLGPPKKYARKVNLRKLAYLPVKRVQSRISLVKRKPKEKVVIKQEPPEEIIQSKLEPIEINQNPSDEIDGQTIKEEEEDEQVNVDDLSENMKLKKPKGILFGNPIDASKVLTISAREELKRRKIEAIIAYRKRQILQKKKEKPGEVSKNGSKISKKKIKKHTHKHTSTARIESEDFTNIYTRMCKKQSVNLVCKTIGNICNRWGKAEQIICSVIIRRCDTFFFNRHYFTAIGVTNLLILLSLI